MLNWLSGKLRNRALVGNVTYGIRRAAEIPTPTWEVSHDRLNTWTLYFWAQSGVGSHTALLTKSENKMRTALAKTQSLTFDGDETLFLLIYATSGFEPCLNPRSCVVRPLTTAGSAKMSRRVPFLAQAFLAQEDIGCEDTDGV